MSLETGLFFLLSLSSSVLGVSLWRSKHRAKQVREQSTAVESLLRARYVDLEERFRILAESCGAGIVLLDANGVIIETNSAAGRILGCEVETAPGRSLIHVTLSPELQDFVTQGGSRTEEISIGGATTRVLKAYLSPLADPSDHRNHLLVLYDISDLRRLEIVRRDFVANVSHELRTPLSSIRAMAELLLDGALEDQQAAPRFLETIIREAERLTRISSDLLTLSDAESKQPQREVFDLSALVREVSVAWEPRACDRQVQLRCDAKPPIYVQASRDQIEQVVVNLIENAIKYTRAHGQVEVGVVAESENAKLTIRDTGIGIMQEHLPRIFERFYRADKARSRESGGTGLGLSIVKNIVESHGGTVSVTSELNVGSTFTVVLLRAKERGLHPT